MMGDKVEARRTMQAAGVPILPGSPEPIESAEEAKKLAKKIGFPVIIKAAAGGGGRGMRIVRSEGELESNLETAQAEALAAFKNGAVYIERYIERPRHIEIQVLADEHGNCIHLGERECTIQRRHQKLLEEAPSPVITPELREKMGAVAVNACKEIGYSSAGTFEFLLDEDGSFYFMEMNTRIQVEHPVTEMVTLADIVRNQIRIASGEDLQYQQIGRADRRTFDRMPHKCRRSREVYAEPGQDHGLQYPGRTRGSRGYGRLSGIHGAAVLRFDDRKIDRARSHSGTGDRTNAASARHDGCRGDKNDNSAAQKNHGGREVSERRFFDQIHGRVLVE